MVILLLRPIRAVFKSNIASTVTVCIASFEAIGELQRKRLCQSRALCLAGFHERVDNSCKRRAECPRRSFVIVHTEHGQGQAPFTREKSTYLAEVGVTEQILRKFPNSQKSWGN